ncbi:Proclotting enzyme [Nymphon striatum]|nr:Proclotting enzyme [Nymphon striatum]
MPDKHAICVNLHVVKPGKKTANTGDMAGSRRSDNDYSEVLREALVPILTNEACDRAIRSQNIVESFLCAGFNAGGVDACQYDSGGPFVMPSDDGRMYCMGIVSYGIGCAEPGLPGVYTRVPKYLDWLRENMRVAVNVRKVRQIQVKFGDEVFVHNEGGRQSQPNNPRPVVPRPRPQTPRPEGLSIQNTNARPPPEPSVPSGSSQCTTADGRSGICVIFHQCSDSFSTIGSGACSNSGFALVCCPSGEAMPSTNLNPQPPQKSKPSVAPTPKPKPKPISTSGGSVDLFPKDCGESAGTSNRVVGGKEADIGAWPWMAAIYLITNGNPSFHCGGSVINNKYVVTAAHCIVFTNEIVPPDELIIRLGDHNLESDNDGLKPVEYKVIEVTVHKTFNAKTFLNDIALLRIESTISYTRFIKPVCVPYEASFLTDQDISERKGIVTGWGKTSFTSTEFSDVLRETLLPIWTNEACGRAYRTQNIVRSFLCAGEEAGGRDACQYDSGGPFVMPSDDGRMYLMGIVSYGFRCAEPGFPGVYTRVPKYLDWLRENMRNTVNGRKVRQIQVKFGDDVFTHNEGGRQSQPNNPRPVVPRPRPQKPKLSVAPKPKPKPISTSGGSVDLFPKDCGESAKTSIRVVAGNEADLGAWPWMAAIYLITDGIPSFHCGGSVINNKYVVTAAHCMGFTNNIVLPEKLIIRLGIINLESDDDGLKPVEYKVAKVTVHKHFNAKTFLNDIALLRIESTIKFTRFIKPVCVPYEASFLTDQDISERKGIVTGWGKHPFRNQKGGKAFQSLLVRGMTDELWDEVCEFGKVIWKGDVLRETLLPIWTNEACGRVYKTQRQNIVGSFLCAGGEAAGGQDACQALGTLESLENVIYELQATLNSIDEHSVNDETLSGMDKRK